LWKELFSYILSHCSLLVCWKAIDFVNWFCIPLLCWSCLCMPMIYIHVCICTYICMYKYVHNYIPTYIYIYNVYIYLYTHTYIYLKIILDWNIPLHNWYNGTISLKWRILQPNAHTILCSLVSDLIFTLSYFSALAYSALSLLYLSHFSFGILPPQMPCLESFPLSFWWN
jgi:hypothetical protein